MDIFLENILKKYLSLNKLKHIFFIFLMASPVVFGQGSGDAFSKNIKKAKQFQDSNLDTSIYFATKAANYAQKTKHTKNEIDAALYLADLYEQKDKPLQQIRQLQKVLAYHQVTNISKSKNQLFYDIAHCYNSLAQYDSSILYLNRALFDLPSKDLTLKGEIETMFGVVYSNLKRFDTSINYYLKAKKTFIQLGDSLGIGKANGNIGDYYLNLKGNEQPLKALSYFKQSLNYFPKDQEIDIEIAYCNIGACFGKMKMIDSAAYYNNKALMLSKQIGDFEGESICLNNLATDYRDQGKMELAMKLYFQSLEIAQKNNLLGIKKDILLNISETYKELGKFKESLDFYDRHIKLKDSIFDQENSKFIVETQEKYDASQRDKQIAELKVTKQRVETEKLSMKYNVIIGLSVLAIIFLTVFWYFRAKVIRMNNERQLAINTAALDSEEKERLRISQEIHDGLGGVLGMSRMLFSRTKKILVEKDEELYQRIDKLLVEANSRSRSISHELFSPTLKQFGLNKALEELLGNVKQINPDCEVEFENNGSDEALSELVSLNLFRISQELINNTIKYAQATNIKLMLNINQQSVNFHFADNGIGVNLEKAKKGVGLKSIQSRVNRFKGQVKFHSAEGKGFEVEIKLN